MSLLSPSFLAISTSTRLLISTNARRRQGVFTCRVRRALDARRALRCDLAIVLLKNMKELRTIGRGRERLNNELREENNQNGKLKKELTEEENKLNVN